MKLISWNIQWSLGADGKVDPRRIVKAARALADFDVLCLQEVAAGFPDPGLRANSGDNQFEAFARLLPGFTAVPVASVDVIGADGKRHVFGNMVLSRLPVLRVLRHQLPWPVDPAVISMPRTLLEVTIDSPLGPVRVMNTHLEYYSLIQRTAQVDAVRKLHAEACARASGERSKELNPTPFLAVPQSAAAILTGDFNLRPEDPLHERIQQPPDSGGPRLVDAWQHLHPGQPHPHSVGLYDPGQWPEPFTCDFMFVTEDWLPHVKRLHVDQDCNYSDHQPLLLELG
ncbi:endonuclease/exonuclease/phosphatase family protein [Lacisediminimonas profundi]|uniref:endonuclease/exonuclease/phosphatase family protein n=1 Tax=Lacisediminimonas profundi TaxID=2603856 RepID=UPI00124AF253|nr:endonuclease/exonuclease/phosphatase family protein [Lacisediminimonas profundi]